MPQEPNDDCPKIFNYIIIYVRFCPELIVAFSDLYVK